MKKILASILSVAMLVTLLSGCDMLDMLKRDKNTSSDTNQSVTLDTSSQQNSVDFTIEQTQSPDFESLDSQPAEVFPTEDFEMDEEPDSVVNTSDDLFTIVGEYAYKLDPQTLLPVGDPLDPITHEPVDSAEANSVANDAATAEDETSNDVKPVEIIPEDVKLPNTGIFLEDD